MKTARYKVPAIVLAAVLILSLIPAGVLAAGDNSAPASDATYTISDSNPTVKIESDGTYTITGTCSEGSITVKKGVTATLILKNLTLSSTATAPLTCSKGSSVTLCIVGAVTLNDNEPDESSEDFEGAAIKVKSGASLTITGSGTLNVNGNVKNGIKGAASSTVTIAGATVNVRAANTGVASDNEVIVSGGKLTVTAGNEGIKASPDEDDTESLGKITISGGTVTVTAADDGVHADGDMLLSGGTITVSAGDDAFHADGDLTVDGADLTVTRSYEGIEGANVYLNSGSATVVASNDGVNAAADGTASSLTINGGYWYINAGGDGLDAGGDSNGDNGTITINGGVTEVYGAANNGNGALDAGRGITYNGGTILAVGMSGMAETPGGDHILVFGSAMGGGMQMGGMMGGFGGMNGAFDRQSGMTQTQSGSSISISAGNTIVIKDSSGSVVYSATAVKNANSVVFASDDLVSGETYTLYVNGSAVATAAAGSNAGASGMMGQPGQMGGMSGQNGMNGQMGGMDQGAAFGGRQNGGNTQSGQSAQAPAANDPQQSAPALGQGQQSAPSDSFDIGGQQQFGGMNGQFGMGQPGMGMGSDPFGGMQQNAPAMGGFDQQQQPGGFGFGGQQQFGGMGRQQGGFGGPMGMGR